LWVVGDPGSVGQRDRGVVEVIRLERGDRAATPDVEDEVHGRDRRGACPVVVVPLERDLRTRHGGDHVAAAHDRVDAERGATITPSLRRHDAEDRRRDDRREVGARSLEVDLDVGAARPQPDRPRVGGSARQVRTGAADVGEQRDQR